MNDLYFNNHSCTTSKDIFNDAGDEIDDYFDSIEPIISRIIEDIYVKGAIGLNQDYISSTAQLLTEKIYEAFNFDGDFTNPDFDTPDLEFIKQLRTNAYYFVGGKNKLLNKSFQNLLLDENNVVRSFSKFKQEAEKTNIIFNKNYLKTEYNTAILNAQSAAQWQSFEDDDILQYSAVMDARTRPEHARLNGLQLKKSDSLWNSIMPQNSWGCRCHVLIIPDGKASKLTSKQRGEFKKEVDKEFRFNPGNDGILFPKDHAYLKTLTKDDKDLIDKLYY